MGRAILRVQPEVLAHFVACLPATTRIVGSASDDVCVALWLEADDIINDGGAVVAVVHDGPLTRTITIEQQPV
jgi:hypothetical protein